MHFHRHKLLAILLAVRGTARIAPVVACVILAAKLWAVPPPTIEMKPSDPSPAPSTTSSSSDATETSTSSSETPVVTKTPDADTLTTTSSFQDVQMATPNVGWAWTADNTLARSADGGRTWTSVGPSGCDHATLGALSAWVMTCDASGGRVHVTSDGGRTWSYASAATTDSRTPLSAHGLQFTDAMHGFAQLTFGIEGEETYAYRTSDGGRTWRQLAGAATFDGTTTFIDARRGWRSVNHVLERTTDGGDTWTTHPDVVACSVDSVPTFTGAESVIVGNCPSGWHAFRTSDGGEHWVAGPKVEITDPATAVNGSQAWLWGNDQFVASTNGGRTFEPAISIRSGATFQIVGPSRGFELTWMGDDVIVSRTTDGGRTFSSVLTTSAVSRWGLSFADSEHGMFFVAFDSSGTRVLATSDGGASWRFLH